MYCDNTTTESIVNDSSSNYIDNIELAFSQSGVRYKEPLTNIPFTALIDKLRCPIEETKDGSYFARASMRDNGLTRSTSNMVNTSNILIIDGDSSINIATGEVEEGAPSFNLVSKRLALMGIAHIAYTSYSHKTKGERYRLIIPTLTPYTAEILPALTDHIISLIGDIQGKRLDNVKENNVWAQAWYLGRKGEQYQVIDQLGLTPFCFFPPIDRVDIGDGDGVDGDGDGDGDGVIVSSTHNIFPDKGVISLIHHFNANHPIEDVLTKYGFKLCNNGRWLHPESQSGEGGGVILDNGKYYEHGQTGKLSDNLPHDAFDIDCAYGNKTRDLALKAIGLTKLSNGLSITEHNNKCNSDLLDRSGDKVLIEIVKTLNNYIEGKGLGSQLNVEVIADYWSTIYWNPRESKFYIMQMTGYEFNVYSETQLKRVFSDLFGNLFISSGDSDLFSAVLVKLLNKVLIYKQATTLNYNVDMWASKTSLVVENGSAIATYPFKEFNVDKGALNNEITKDWLKHYPRYDEFLDLLVASRFASDRKQAYFWLHAPSNWGKSLLVSIFKKLGVVTELSVSEIEKAFNGSPVGREAHDFINSWILCVEEFRAVNAELKQLESSLSFAPKFKGTITTPLYMKLFLSAENVDSLAGEAGVDAQFANRFSSLEVGDGLIDDRDLFKHDPSSYVRGVVAYTSDSLNRKVMSLLQKDKREAVRESERLLRQYNKEHSIKIKYNSLDDTLKDIAEKIRGELKSEGVFSTHLKCTYEGKDAILVQQVAKKINTFINNNFDKSEVVKLNRRNSEIASLVDESGRSNTRSKLSVLIDGKTERKRGILIYT